jgi:flagellar assembly factor FliW
MAFATAATLQLDPGDSPAAPSPARVGRMQVQTRFGRFEIDADSVIEMPKGPHGFPGLRRYALLTIPGAEGGNFRLLQSIDDASVGFIVLPLSLAGGVVAEDDIDQALGDLNVPRASAVFLLLVTLRRGEDGQTAMTANLRAPVVVDSDRRTARQYIFPNAEYPMRMPIAAA